MLGGSCSPCCTHGDCPGNRPITDPKDEGNWVPSGEWPNVTWTFVPNPGDESGETWFFYGSRLTSGTGITSLNDPRITDWYNICNWYSTGQPNWTFFPVQAVVNRASRLPDDNATVHIYTAVSTASGPPPQVKRAYFWQTRGDSDEFESGRVSLLPDSTLVTTDVIHNTQVGSFFARGARNRGVLFGGAAFGSRGMEQYDGQPGFGISGNDGTVNGGALLGMWGVPFLLPPGETFGEADQDTATNGGGGILGGQGAGTINGGAILKGRSGNVGTINDGAIFNHRSQNVSNNLQFPERGVFGGAVFNHLSRNESRVEGGAVFNDEACSTASFGSPPYFGTSADGPPVCNGTALPFNPGVVFCGCG